MKTKQHHAEIAAGLIASPLALAAPASVGNDGLFVTYDGNALGMELQLTDEGPEQVLAYVDLDSLEWLDRVPALNEHRTDEAVGWWEKTAVDRGALVQRLHLLAMPAEGEERSENHFIAAGIRGLHRSGMPLQASVRVMPDATRAGYWETMTEPFTVNGRQVDPSAAPMRTVVLRKGILRETSICTLGRAARTGQLAASLLAALADETPPQTSGQPQTETPHMDPKERKAALVETHGEEYLPTINAGIVDGLTDEEISAAITADKEQQAEEAAAAVQAELDAKTAENEQVKAELATVKASLAEAQASLASERAKRSGPPANVVNSSEGQPALVRSKMTDAQRSAYANKFGGEALAALPYE